MSGIFPYALRSAGAGCATSPTSVVSLATFADVSGVISRAAVAVDGVVPRTPAGASSIPARRPLAPGTPATDLGRELSPSSRLTPGPSRCTQEPGGPWVSKEPGRGNQSGAGILSGEPARAVSAEVGWRHGGLDVI